MRFQHPLKLKVNSPSGFSGLWMRLGYVALMILLTMLIVNFSKGKNQG